MISAFANKASDFEHKAPQKAKRVWTYEAYTKESAFDNKASAFAHNKKGGGLAKPPRKQREGGLAKPTPTKTQSITRQAPLHTTKREVDFRSPQ